MFWENCDFWWNELPSRQVFLIWVINIRCVPIMFAAILLRAGKDTEKTMPKVTSVQFYIGFYVEKNKT
jgi:hypothetical protein